MLLLIFYQRLPSLEGRGNSKGGRRERENNPRALKNCIFIGDVSGRYQSSHPVLPFCRFPEGSPCRLLVESHVGTQQRPRRPLLLVLSRREGPGSAFACRELQLCASAHLVALQLCAAGTAFWRRSSTLSASRNRRFCSTNELGFIDSEFRETR